MPASTAWVSNLFYGKGPHWSLYAGLQAARGKITKVGILNCLNSCQIFTVYIQFANVAMGRILQPGRPWVGDQRSEGQEHNSLLANRPV
jgi:hypothetical protein